MVRNSPGRPERAIVSRQWSIVVPDLSHVQWTRGVNYGLEGLIKNSSLPGELVANCVDCRVMYNSIVVLFAGWAAFLLFGIPSIVLMLRSSASARLLAWLALASGLLQSGYFLFAQSSPYRYSGSNSTMLLNIAIWSGPAIFSGLISILGTSYLKRRKMTSIGLTCAKCGYLLWGNESGACPECGVAIPIQQLEKIRKTERPDNSESSRDLQVPADTNDVRRGHGFGRHVMLTLAIGGPLSVVGFVCGALSAHVGDFFRIPSFILCPLTSLFYIGTGYLPIMLRNSIHQGMTGLESVALFCLLQFLTYFLFFTLIDKVRHAGPRPPAVQGPRDEHRRRLLIGAGALVLLAIAGLIYANRGIPFERESWMVRSTEDRGRMAKDLVASGCLMGQSASQVLHLLGPPTEHHFSYRGNDRNLFIDLDTQGRYRADRVPTELYASFPAEPFSSDQWRARPPKGRSGMIHTLTSQPAFFSSKSYDEIIQSLGAPDDYEMITYHVGRWGRLLLHLDRNRVQGVYLQ